MQPLLRPNQLGPSDPEIAHIVVTADKIDIDAGKLAKSKSKNKEVKKFAQTMITDHTGVNKQATDLAKKLGVTPKDGGAQQEVPTFAQLKGPTTKKSA